MNTITDPLVSVIIPTYNRAANIENAVKSVMAQTYTNWEIIISDDGSNDNIKAVVERLMDLEQRIHFIRDEVNRGAQVARNRGIKSAQGLWIAFLDSDDEWLPDSLALRMNVAKHENVSVVHSEMYIKHSNEPLKYYYVPVWSGNIYQRILAREGPVFPALLVKKDALQRIGYLDETAISYQEWNTSIRLAKFYSFGFLKTPTFIYDYRTPGAISRSHSRNGKGYADIVRKFFWEMLIHVGPKGMVYHYDRIADWYQQANEIGKVKFYKNLAFLFKCLSPTIVLGKICQVINKNRR